MAIEIPSLGRPFSLGMLYDCRDDKLIPGITLWKREALERDVCRTSQNNTSFEVLASDRVSDKSSALKISASLKVSFLSGLINVGGSATYLNDVKSSRNQARVTLKYSRTTRFEQLSMDHLSTDNMTYHDVFDKGTATHVVTGILYGAQAFFIFDQEVSPSDNTLNVQGNLQTMIWKIPQSVGVPQITNKDKEIVKNFSCTFHGDFALERNPVTYEDAIKIYSSLPQFIGQNGEKAVPVRIWLYPLENLDSKAARLVRDITESLVFRAENIIQQMSEVSMECNDMMKHLVAETFPDIKKKISQFKEQCGQFTLMFQKQLGQTLLKVRGGELKEDALLDILSHRENSPFGKLHIEEFLRKKQTEMDVVKSYLNVLPDIRVIATEHKLNEIVIDQMTEFTVCFNFASLNEIEQHLEDINDWLPTMKYTFGDVYLDKRVPQWYEDRGMAKRARKCVKEFQAFVEANVAMRGTQFVVSSVHDQSNPGISIYLYECGDLVTTMFEPPSKPNLPIITNKTHDSMELVLQPADFGKESVEGYKVEYKCAETNNWISMNIENKQEKTTVTGLKANSNYKFRYYAVSKPGLSVVSEETEAEKTLPTSPPGAPQITAESNAITVFWMAPVTVGDGVSIKEYNVQYKEENESVWLEKRTGSKTESCVIRGLKIKTIYQVCVRAICDVDGDSAPSEEREVGTLDMEFMNIAHQMLKQSTLLMKGQPRICQLKTDDTNYVYRQSMLGKEKPQTMNKVILLIGASGSGKTTLINGMANYILGVSWKDNFRFKLVHKGPTSEVTMYKMNYESGYNVPYSLTLIDVPGFRDTQGITQGRMTTEAIHSFLISDSGIDQIDAVCFVVQASVAQMTLAQKYIFKSLLSKFGKDLKENILILINFADGGRPSVLDAIKAAGISCPLDSTGDPVHFKFNNSALFANNTQSNMSINKMFWKVGEQSMGDFLRALEKIETKSLRLTKNVLRIQEELENTLQTLCLQVDAGLANRIELRLAKKALQLNTDRMTTNKQYEYERETCLESMTAIDEFIISCSKCNFICHYPCACGVTDEDWSKCSAMNKKGWCTTCPKACPWKDHYVEKSAVDYVMEKEMVTDRCMKLEYEVASAEVIRLETGIHTLDSDYSDMRQQVYQTANECQRLMKVINDLALGPNPLLSPEDIDLLIQSEEQESKSGDQESVRSLKEARASAGLVEQVMRGRDVLLEQEVMLDEYKED
ncbi:uncharacterized protein O3C94_005965 [Discoglossus pictus]